MYSYQPPRGSRGTESAGTDGYEMSSIFEERSSYGTVGSYGRRYNDGHENCCITSSSRAGNDVLMDCCHLSRFTPREVSSYPLRNTVVDYVRGGSLPAFRTFRWPSTSITKLCNVSFKYYDVSKLMPMCPFWQACDGTACKAVKEESRLATEFEGIGVVGAELATTAILIERAEFQFHNPAYLRLDRVQRKVEKFLG